MIPLTLIILSGLIGLIWISRHAMISIERRRGFILRETYQRDAGVSPALCDPLTGAAKTNDLSTSTADAGETPASRETPFISVVVAAKDEQDNIAACVESMLTQDYPHFEILVANDRSSDRTAEIVADIAARDSRVTLVNIDHLPAGWGGKNHAMQHAIKRTKGEWICLIDADCTQTSPRTLSVALAHAQDTQSDLLSLLPVLEMKGFWENAIQPVCGGLMMIWFHPDKVNNPRRRNAYANGAFMLMRRSTYEAIGTHQAVRDQVNEDMHMAARVKSSGLRLRVSRNEGLYMVRMYSSLRQIYRGWTRIFYGTFGTRRRLIASLAVLLIVSMSPYFSAAAGFSLAAFGGENASLWRTLGWVGAATVAIQISVIFRFLKLLCARPLFCWSYFVGCFVAMLALIAALGKLRKGATIVWRNTSYATAPGEKKTT
ncbi:MAG: glycosyltransferase [Phycisphaerae bacterium]|nr:glycosyltransferase [Phycisphaerae bacterium]